MPLVIGTRLGPYEVVAALGAGGMGEVYRARDTKLNRDVAIKVLPDLFASDPERLARFEREAQALAALNHPNIAQIYGVEESSDVRALVMELVEGTTLAERLGRAGQVGRVGQVSQAGRARSDEQYVVSGFGRTNTGLPLDETLAIARQIADALEAAHDKGIIHRDLKPANVMITAAGVVKVLDFGLAAVTESAGSHDVNATHSPTLTMAASRAGVILGTAGYMSPEQAAGKPVDRRADIWSFGVVLWEMLTGQRLFDGETISHTLADVLRAEIDFNKLPTDTPATIRHLLRRCLDRNANTRLRDIGEARIAISNPGKEPETPIAPARQGGALPWAAAVAAVLAAATMLALWAPWRAPGLPAPVRVSAELGVDAAPAVNPSAAVLALSPDGTMLVFAARKGTTSQLYVRRLGQLQAAPLSGTTDARDPFFSPDGQWIAFFAGGKLKKISVTGGAAVTLCDATADRGGAWAEDGSIVFQPAQTGPLLRVSDTGGKPEPLTMLAEGETTQRWPQVLPGGKAILYSGHSNVNGFDDANLVVQPLASGVPSGPRKVVQRGGYYGRYLASGHLVYIHGNTLFAAPFDLGRLELIGSPVPVLEGVAATPSSGFSGAAAIAISETGTVAYLPGGNQGESTPIQWMDRTGKVTPLRAAPSNWSNPQFSPDGRQLALEIDDGTQRDVWVYEWARDTLTRLTIDAANDGKPVWTPDGRRIVFRSDRGAAATGGAFDLYWQRADGTGNVQRLTESRNAQFATSWHPSGKFLAFYETNPQTRNDLMILPMEGDEATGWKPGKPTAFLNTPANEIGPMFSPDGRWIAYTSSDSGRPEVFVRPFPGPGSKWQISTEGGNTPTWSRARHELFFDTPDNHIMVASYTVEGDSFRADKPRLWSDKPFEQRPYQRSFDLHPDGDRFALAAAAEGQAEVKQDKVVFIFNFFDELRRIAPARK